MGATATVKGGLFETLAIPSLTQIQGRTPGLVRAVRQAMGKKGMRKARELALTLDGVVAGSAASDTNARVEASSELGGKRTVETETIVGRNSLAADVTELNAYLFAFSTKTTFGSSPVANKDGNPLGTQ